MHSIDFCFSKIMEYIFAYLEISRNIFPEM